MRFQSGVLGAVLLRLPPRGFLEGLLVVGLRLSADRGEESDLAPKALVLRTAIHQGGGRVGTVRRGCAPSCPVLLKGQGSLVFFTALAFLARDGSACLGRGETNSEHGFLY